MERLLERVCGCLDLDEVPHPGPVLAEAQDLQVDLAGAAGLQAAVVWAGMGHHAATVEAAAGADLKQRGINLSI